MADRAPVPSTPKLRDQWGNFAWSKGQMLPDVTAIIGAIDVVFGECDR